VVPDLTPYTVTTLFLYTNDFTGLLMAFNTFVYMSYNKLRIIKLQFLKIIYVKVPDPDQYKKKFRSLADPDRDAQNLYIIQFVFLINFFVHSTVYVSSTSQKNPKQFVALRSTIQV
jgi:hypothetical protein